MGKGMNIKKLKELEIKLDNYSGDKKSSSFIKLKEEFGSGLYKYLNFDMEIRIIKINNNYYFNDFTWGWCKSELKDLDKS